MEKVGKIAKISDYLNIEENDYKQITDEIDRLLIRKNNFGEVLKELSQCMASKNDFIKGVYLGRKIEKSQRLNKYFEMRGL